MNYLYIKGYDYKLDNLREIMNNLYDGLINEIYICNGIPSNLLFRGKIDILENPKEYFIELKSKIEEIKEQSIVTLGDCKKILTK